MAGILLYTALYCLANIFAKQNFLLSSSMKLAPGFTVNQWIQEDNEFSLQYSGRRNKANYTDQVCFAIMKKKEI